MGQLDAFGERRTTLVVDEQVIDPVGAQCVRQPEHPRLQEFAFTGTGGASHQGVGPVAAQVDDEWLQPGMPDDRPQLHRVIHWLGLPAIADDQ